MENNEFNREIQGLAQTFNTKGVQWAVAGAVAANHYRGEVRATSDLDILIALAGQDINDIALALENNGWESIRIIENWLIRAHHIKWGRLDVLASTTDYESVALNRSIIVEVDSFTYQTLAIEDVLILKLIANRFRDAADIESILATKPDLDQDYMNNWLDEFDLRDRLNKIKKIMDE